MELQTFTTSAELAKRADVSTEYLNGLIDEYTGSLSKYGGLKFKTSADGSISCFSLNEPQAMLIVLLMKNTTKSMDLKQEFIKKMHDMRKEQEQWN
ncbi:hypothetical protein [Fructilactobacillus frigidiflavus]|uniref:hypothetical protein n=1 Tax=Fructilactobacillus frigidiflavus TaxID=3242688 RepID=UPI00375801FF